MGGSSDPSVLRSPGATPQKGRAAHGPRHPAVTSPPRQCYSCVRFRLFGFSGILLGFMFGVLSLWGWDTVGLVPFKTCPLLGKLFVVLSFFSVCLVDFVVVALSLSLSPRRWGNPNPVWGLGFPLCSLLLGQALRVRPVLRAPQVHLGQAPLLFFCFFFFFPLRRRRSLVCWSVRWRSVAFLFGCFVFRLVVGGCCFGSVGPFFAVHARWVGWM